MGNLIRRMDLAAAGVLAFGLAVRVFLFVSGRNPMDGDEAVIGMMGADMARLVRLPLYFYGQHYMGSLEMPLVALIQRLGPEGWMFSAWPIRLAGWTYFLLMGTTHFLLCRRFFGRGAALGSLFFICAGPWFWTEYSSRLRHASLMMGMGGLTALAALAARDRWLAGGAMPARRWALIGLAGGIAWWHYQLVVVFIPAVLVVLFYPPSPAIAFLRRLGGETRAAHALRIAGLALMTGAIIVLAQLSLGRGGAWMWIHRDAVAYWQVFAALGTVLGAGAFVAGGFTRGGGQEIERKRAPVAALAGFVLGCTPIIYYMATLEREFWVVGYAMDTSRLLRRMLDVLLLEFAGLVEIVRHGQDDPALVRLGPWSHAALVILGGGAACMIRALARPFQPGERMGAIFYGVIAFMVIFLSALTPHPATMEKPRFLLPVMLTVAAGFGLLADAVVSAVRSRGARMLTVAALAGGVLILHGSNWLSMKPVAMDWPSGLEKENVEVLRSLRAHGVHRANLRYSTDFMLLGHNLMFASGMRIRFNEGAITDRFMDIYGPGDFEGPMHVMLYPDQVREGRKGFFAGPFFVYPLAPGETIEPPAGAAQWP